ncbi:hypothetical protein ACFQXB_01220 [Plastorhodobacter daqingensis]|uniref:Uncharacterized protein n=1 Tax=Plastorhodobacter daqingensis TaxID=1387281 RepID=A0ABW2UFQ1_9RHOB
MAKTFPSPGLPPLPQADDEALHDDPEHPQFDLTPGRFTMIAGLAFLPAFILLLLRSFG